MNFYLGSILSLSILLTGCVAPLHKKVDPITKDQTATSNRKPNNTSLPYSIDCVSNQDGSQASIMLQTPGIKIIKMENGHHNVTQAPLSIITSEASTVYLEGNLNGAIAKITIDLSGKGFVTLEKGFFDKVIYDNCRIEERDPILNTLE